MRYPSRLLPIFALILGTVSVYAASETGQGAAPVSSAGKVSPSSSVIAPSGDAELSVLPDAPAAQTGSSAPAASQPPAGQDGGPKQTKRILFIIPNFRSVSADEKLPPTTSSEKFKIFLEDSFDYSAFLEVGLLAGYSDLHKGEPEFHHGAAAYARYYWHSFADNTDGNLMTEFLVPVATREDPRYYTLGHGGLLRRSVYSVSRLVITRNNQGNATPNLSEIVGNGAASGVSDLYYPSPDRTWTKTGQRWALQIGIDGVSNLIKEFWPDINARLFHDKY